MSEDLKGKVVLEPKPTEICPRSKEGKHGFGLNIHLDMTDRAIWEYECENCGERITKTYYRMDNDPFMSMQ